MGGAALLLLLVAGAQGGDTTISYDTLPYLVRQARYIPRILRGIVSLFRARPGLLVHPKVPFFVLILKSTSTILKSTSSPLPGVNIGIIC